MFSIADVHNCLSVFLNFFFWQAFYFLLTPIIFLLLKSPREGAQTNIYCAVDEAVEGVSGKYFLDCKVVQPSKPALDDNMAEQLWEVSAELVGL